jgi:hypothetical protein
MRVDAGTRSDSLPAGRVALEGSLAKGSGVRRVACVLDGPHGRTATIYSAHGDSPDAPTFEVIVARWGGGAKARIGGDGGQGAELIRADFRPEWALMSPVNAHSGQCEIRIDASGKRAIDVAGQFGQAADGASQPARRPVSYAGVPVADGRPAMLYCPQCPERFGQEWLDVCVPKDFPENLGGAFLKPPRGF